MSGATVAALLADLIGPAESGFPRGTPAKAANPAKPRASIDAAADSGTCERLRKVANPQPPSQKFAALRRPSNPVQSEYPCGSSQLSQNSQGVPGTIASGRPYRLTTADADAVHAEPWNDAAIGRFVARAGLFMRRGIDATDADDLAERLHLRDVQGDDRRLCLECRHFARWRCGNARVAGVGRDLPEAFATQLQRCIGFAEAVAKEPAR